MKFTLRQLVTFAAVARTAHFGKAADLLELAQPTVSNDIKALEKALGITVFSRSRAGTTLTDAGRDLLPYVRSVLNAAEDLDGYARRLAVGGVPPVRLAATPSLVNRLVPATLQQLATVEPRVPVEVVEVATGGLPGALAAGDADVGIGHFVGEVRGCGRTTIGFDRLWLLAGKDVLALDRRTSVAEMSPYKLLIWPREQNPEYYDFVVGLCCSAGLTPETVEAPMRISGAYSYLLTSGEAFAIVPEDYALEASQSLSCVPLDPPARLPLQAIWRKPPAPGAGRMLAVIRSVQHDPP